MYIYTYFIHVHVHTHIYMHIYIYLFDTCICTYIYLHIIHVYVHIYFYIYIMCIYVKLSVPAQIPGKGQHPDRDPWNQRFTETYYPDRLAKAGQPIAGPLRFVFDGVQGDQDFIAALFTLNRLKVYLQYIFWVSAVFT